jgi:Zn-finger nucleic acid-binding protein
MSTEKPSRNEGGYFAQQNADLLRQQRGLEEAAALESERKTHYMKCPKDGHDLTTTKFHGVQIETCPHCGGVWLDAGELAEIAHEEHPALLTRVLSDAFQSLRAARKQRRTGA